MGQQSRKSSRNRKLLRLSNLQERRSARLLTRYPSSARFPVSFCGLLVKAEHWEKGSLVNEGLLGMSPRLLILGRSWDSPGPYRGSLGFRIML